MIRGSLGVMVIIFAALFTGLASAEPDAEDRGSALTLFTDATRMIAAGHPADVCPRLEEAERLAPGFGIEYTLGECYEQTARVASAWSMFERAAGTARAAGNASREAAATSKSHLLETRLSRLVIDVPAESKVPGLTVLRDGHEVGPVQFGTAMPLDVGEHSIRAIAPGRVAWEARIDVTTEGVRVVKAVPRLEPMRRDAATAPMSPSRHDGSVPGRSTTLRSMGWTSLGVGAAGLVTGAVLVLVAKGDHDGADAFCEPNNECKAPGVSLRNSAVDSANGATIAFAAGAILAAAGGGLLVFGRPGAPTVASVGVGVGAAPAPGGGALFLSRAW